MKIAKGTLLALTLALAGPAVLTETASLVAAQPGQQLTGMMITNGLFVFVLNGPVGSNLVIQASGDLVNWSPLSTNTIPASGSVSITDPGVSNHPKRFYRAVATSAVILPSLIATNLNGPGWLLPDGDYIYFVDNSSTDGIIKRAPKTGGMPSTLVTGLTTSDGSLPWFVVKNGTIYGVYGGYVAENVFSAPATGGSATTLASITGGQFFGVAGSLVYYASGFSYINSIPLSGGTPAQLTSGYFARSSAMDDTAIYFVNYATKDLMKCTLSSGSVTPLITGNSSEGGPTFVDDANVYFNLNGNLLSVPKSGGSVTPLISSGNAAAYASDGTHVFFVETNSIKSVPVSGGSDSVIVSVPPGSFSSLAVDASFIYWGRNSAGYGSGQIWRTIKP